jgi:hypothetical protein
MNIFIRKVKRLPWLAAFPSLVLISHSSCAGDWSVHMAIMRDRPGTSFSTPGYYRPPCQGFQLAAVPTVGFDSQEITWPAQFVRQIF